MEIRTDELPHNLEPHTECEYWYFKCQTIHDWLIPYSLNTCLCSASKLEDIIALSKAVRRHSAQRGTARSTPSLISASTCSALLVVNGSPGTAILRSTWIRLAECVERDLANFGCWQALSISIPKSRNAAICTPSVASMISLWPTSILNWSREGSAGKFDKWCFHLAFILSRH